MQRMKNKHWSYQIVAMVGMLVCMSFGFTRPATTSSSVMVTTATTAATATKSVIEEKMGLYDSLDLAGLGLSREAFEYGLTGYQHLLAQGKILKNNLLSILDFSLPSGKKRLFVIDITTGELVFNTYAAHGRNSGTAMATDFSNQANSFKSSLGFYVTGETYNGKHGESLRLNGEEEGINDNALARGIVMHSAAYADESIVASQGYIGRSQGCPALPENIARDVITKIKNGSLLFLYSPDKTYASRSKILNEKA
ncbi:MAG: hypothetical protein JWQ78_1996 [Sediminibacterium sp.]|nr:hypothetical protein [Sediminibacterium sp.]